MLMCIYFKETSHVMFSELNFSALPIIGCPKRDDWVSTELPNQRTSCIRQYPIRIEKAGSAWGVVTAV